MGEKSMITMSRPICFAPLLFTLGCASSPPPAAPSPSPAPEAPEPGMVAVLGVLPADDPAPEVAAAPPAPHPPPPPAVAYSLVVRDLIDPPASPLLDAVSADVRRGDWAKASVSLAKLLPGIDEKGQIHEKIAAHALAGRIAARMKNAKKADAEYEKTLELSKEPSTEPEGNDADKRHRHQTVAFAVGEAQFYFAEKKGKEADDVAMPKYHGSGSREDVLAFINQKIVEWIKTKRPKTEEAEKQYAKILAHQPSPHPHWAIAASARVGQLWARFVDDFRNAPMPKEWMSDGVIPGTELTYTELRTEYRSKLEDASEAQFESARRAFKACVDYATKFNIANEDSKRCQAWLAAHPSAK